MTCIVGIEHKDCVYIGGDSAGVNVNSLSMAVRADEKVFRKGDMIFGFTSSFRMGQIIRYSFNPPAQVIGEDDYAYLCGPWVEALIGCFKDKGYASVENNIVSGGTFLVGFNGVLYYVEDDFQVGRRVESYDACGCGFPYAIGAMSMIIDDKKLGPEEKITSALEVAERFSAGVKGPFVIKKLGGENAGVDFTLEEETE